MKNISQIRARMMAAQAQPQPQPQLEARKVAIIRYTREELLALRPEIESTGEEQSADDDCVSPHERDQLFSIENLMKFAQRAPVPPIEPSLVVPSLEPADEAAAFKDPCQPNAGGKTTKSYLSFAVSLAKNSPEVASKLRNILGLQEPPREQESNAKHSVNIPITMDAGPLGVHKLNACVSFSIKINLNIDGLGKASEVADQEERKAFIRQQIQVSTSDCHLTFQ